MNSKYLINVWTEDSDGDGNADYMVEESSNRPEHKSVYRLTTNTLYEAFDFATNLYKYAETKTSASYSGTPGLSG